MNHIKIFFILLVIVTIISSYLLLNLKKVDESFISKEYNIPCKGLVGWYNKSSFNNQVWNDLSGLGNNIIIKGGSPNIKSNYITGTSNVNLYFPKNIKTDDYILIHVSKYNEKNKNCSSDNCLDRLFFFIDPIVPNDKIFNKKGETLILPSINNDWVIGEILIYNRQLLQEEINEIKDYTREKFNLE